MNWIVCPRCLDACQGKVGEICSVCGTAMVSTPLFKNSAVALEISEAPELMIALGNWR